MKSFFKFTTIVFLLLFLSVLVFFVSINNNNDNGASLTFTNKSGHSISRATITVSGKTCGFKGLENLGEVNCYFENLYDSHYHINIELSTGSNINADLGYVTSGMSFNHLIIINSAGEIIFEPSPST